MANAKNPTALFMERMRQTGRAIQIPEERLVTLAQLVVAWLRANQVDKITLEKRVADTALYDSQVAVGKTTINLFGGGTSAWASANSNMPSQNYQNAEGEHMIILSLRGYEGAAGTISASTWKPGFSDVALINGNLDIFNNGIRVTRNLPLANFNSNALGAAFAGVTSDDQGYFYLAEPICWKAQTTCNVVVTLPAASAVTNQNIRLEYHGLQLIG